MVTLNILGFKLGLDFLYLRPPNQPPTLHVVLKPVQPIDTTNHTPLGVPKVAPSTSPPPTKNKNGGNAGSVTPLANKNKTMNPSSTSSTRSPTPCALCDIPGHTTHICLDFPIL